MAADVLVKGWRMAKFRRAALLLSCLTVGSFATSAQGARASLDLRRDASVVMAGGYIVAEIGDVSGDGTSDYLVSSEPRQASYVIFAEKADGHIELDDLGQRGFAIQSGAPDDRPYHIGGAGDVNGDGLDDILVGAPGGDDFGRGSNGVVYVVFGKSSSETVELRHFDLNVQGDAGFRIIGPSTMAFAGEVVSEAGDINGDGLADVLVGAPFRGASYVVFGKKSSEPVDLLTFDLGQQGARGYVIETPSPELNTLYYVTGGLDINGDGVPDPTIGVIRKEGGRGSVYITFGQSSSTQRVLTSRLEDRGIVVRGVRRSGTGHALDQVPDLNRDGRDELLVGAPGFGSTGSRGSAYVVFGRRNPGEVRLAQLGRRGFRIDGTYEKADFGISVVAVPDLNGDSRSELLVGAPRATVLGRPYAGAAYVIFGKAKTRTVRIAALGGDGYRIAGVARADHAGWRVALAANRSGPPTLLIGAIEREGSIGGAIYAVHPLDR